MNKIEGSRAGKLTAMTIVALIAIAITIAVFRLHALGFDMGFIVPEKIFNVELVLAVQGYGERVKIKTFLPRTEERQRVLSEHNNSGDFELKISAEDDNQTASWQAEAVDGKRVLTYSWQVIGRGFVYQISPQFQLGVHQSGVIHHYLQPTNTIQSTAPEIIELARKLLPDDQSMLTFLRSCFDQVQNMGFKPFKGTTDALTALRLGEASCNGRSRLFSALLRSQGLPTRLVGGLILEPGTKRTSHQWAEVWIGGHWIPFDPTNGHFAAIPYNYLTLYRGDQVLFKHTSDVAFKYNYKIKRRFVPRQEVEQKKRVLGFWAVFAQLGIPLELLTIIVMIPLGALVVVIFRNVLGFRTFGTFLPALIAAAARNTGIFWGAVGFCLLIFLVSSLRKLLRRMELLHSPQLAVLLTMVISLMLLLAAVGVHYDLTELGKVTLFPVAILAITSERFAIMEEEEGSLFAWKTMVTTLAVVVVCYLTMSSLSLQILMLAFPELLLVIIAVDLWLGRWVGLRLSEWFRFRFLFGRVGGGGVR